MTEDSSETPKMKPTRLSSSLSAAAIVALALALWLFGSDGSAPTEHGLQQGASAPASSERARSGAPAGGFRDVDGVEGEVEGEAGEEEAAGSARDGRGSPDRARERVASLSTSRRVVGDSGAAVRGAGTAPAPSMSVSEIERRWQSSEPEDRAVATYGSGGMVVSTDRVASEVGVEILRRERKTPAGPAMAS